MNAKPLASALVVLLALSSVTAIAAEQNNGYVENNNPTGDPVVDTSFNPYAKGLPTFPGYAPGVVIDKDNVETYKGMLDPAMYIYIKNGWYKVQTKPAFSELLTKSFREATKANYKNVKLDPKTLQLEGYVSGRPFPQEPSLDDPQAGLKLAWNFLHGLNWGDNGTVNPFYWQYRNMKTGQVERVIHFQFNFLNYKHRFEDSPIPEVTPNPSDLYRGIYVKVLSPDDVRNTQLLIQRYDDDRKQDDAYLYLGFQRRVRRLPTGQTTDSFLGSDLMIQDFEGYNDRVAEMKWTYKGAKDILMPLYYHNELKLSDEFPQPDGYKFVAFGGQGGCFPEITWQLRKTYELEAVPVNNGSPISKRLFYVDAQTGALSRTLIYDRKGNLWKSFIIGKTDPDHHLASNLHSGIPIDDSFSMVDLEAMHCTTGQFKGQISYKLNPPSLFQVQNMRDSGGGD
jgi:hypothetical protein